MTATTPADSELEKSIGPVALPKVSVCIPAYQAGHYLQRVLDSVLAQTYPNLEVVVVDNNSSDTTSGILDGVDDGRLRVITNPDTLPFIENWNLAVHHASGEYVKLICVDDLLKPECVSVQAAVLSRMPDVALVSVKSDYIDDEGQMIAPARGLHRIDGRVSSEKVVKKIIHCGGNPIGAPLAGMFRRADFDRVGGFTADFPFMSDLDLWVRLLRCGDFYGVPEAYASFRVRGGSLSGLTSARTQLNQSLAFVRSIGRDPRWHLSEGDLVHGFLRCHEQTLRRMALFAATDWRVRQRRRRARPVVIDTSGSDVADELLDAPPGSLTTVICAYTTQRWHDLRRAVESALAQDVPQHDIVVVIDHCAPLYQLAHETFESDARVSVLESDRECGLSGARNAGVSAARGDVIAFLDDDAVAGEGWARTLMRHYRDPRVSVVGGSAAAVWPGEERPPWMPAEFDWVVGCSYVGQPTVLSEVRNPLGCNMSLRRSVLEQVGGFSSEVGRVGAHPVGGEETELCIRVAANDPSARILFDPEASVRHHVSADRATLQYFRRRCYHEGMSKAVVADLAGTSRALDAERAYTMAVLPRSLVREAMAMDAEGLARAGAIVYGLAATTLGFLHARARRRLADRMPSRRRGQGDRT
jgi:glycosyltransferase involved in cell wall biosynthesis